jgi:small GTP-binding protein
MVSANFKLILLGDGGTGKTTLAHRYVSGTFLDNTQMTIGVQLHAKEMTIDDQSIILQIWDLGGEDRFRFILPQYCIGAHGGIFVYDLTAPRTLYHIDDWMGVLRDAHVNMPVVIAGTKADLIADRKNMELNAQETAAKYEIAEVYSISSKTGENVENLFEKIARLMIDFRVAKSVKNGFS